MCTNKIKVYNPSKFISLGHYKKLINYCNCGSCPECRKQKRLEWSIRSQYEFRRCFDQGGFMMFDCLTYSEDNVPWIHDHLAAASRTCWDMYCFNRSHIKNFMKRLRSKLTRRKYEHDGRLRYFVGAEYGTDPFKTQRPHYHIILYVNFEIDPIELSRLVAESWTYGRTDGVPYKNRSYVLDHNVIGNGDVSSALRTASYVSKYVLKPYLFTYKLKRHLRMVFDIAVSSNNPAWKLEPYFRDLYSSVLRQCLTFHVESKNFGAYALVNPENRSLLLREQKIRVVDNGNIKNVAAPLYYLRKEFYDVEWFNGKRRWIPNDRYRFFVLSNYEFFLQSRIDKYASVLSSAMTDSVFKDSVDRFYYLLGSRSLTDLALYDCIYKGRYLGGFFPSPEEVLDMSLCRDSFDYRTLTTFNFPVLYGYLSQKDADYFGQRHYSSYYHGDSTFWQPRHMVYDLIPCSVVDDMVCNQNSFSSFVYFDDMLDILSSIASYFDSVVDADSVQNDCQRERYFSLFDI